MLLETKANGCNVTNNKLSRHSPSEDKNISWPLSRFKDKDTWLFRTEL